MTDFFPNDNYPFKRQPCWTAMTWLLIFTLLYYITVNFGSLIDGADDREGLAVVHSDKAKHILTGAGQNMIKYVMIILLNRK